MDPTSHRFLLRLFFASRDILESLVEAVGQDAIDKPGVVRPAWMAGVLGEYDRAFEYYEKAIEERSLVASWLRDPLLDNVRSNPRFRKLFERIGLEP